MIILKDNELYVNCSCGTKFVAMEGDFKWNAFNNKGYVNCPTCDETHYIICTELGSEKPEIKGEKIDNENT